jgi:hypothetical protein
MAKVTIRKDELDLLVETAKRAAKRTNSVVIVAEDRLDLTSDTSPRPETPLDGKSVTLFN